MGTSANVKCRELNILLATVLGGIVVYALLTGAAGLSAVFLIGATCLAFVLLRKGYLLNKSRKD